MSIPLEARIRQNDSFFLLDGLQTELITIKKSYNELKGKLQRDTKIQESYDLKQSTFARSSTILHPLTEVRDLFLKALKPRRFSA